jgi:uncharacterized phage protein (TIGR01671 family)
MQLKFRAYLNGKMYPVHTLEFEADGKLSGFSHVDGECVNLEGAVFMQGTGLKDKEGVEIFEGDIVCLGFITGKGQLSPVIWSDFRSSWTLKFNEFSNNDLYRYTTHGNIAKISGNIHQHSHLLKTN